MSEGGLQRRLGRAFLRQALYISVAAVFSVFVAGLLLERVLIRQALEDEAAYFWDQQRSKRAQALPDTRNLTGYMHEVPPTLRELDVGFHRAPAGIAGSQVYVSERGGERLFMVFDGERVSQLILYFGLVPLAAVLIVLYVSTWFAFRLSGRAVSPLITLAREIETLDPEAPDPAAFALDRFGDDADAEVRTLAAAIADFANRLNSFVDRERNFTRDASHELRSPLTVIKIAADLLLQRDDLDAIARKGAERIERAARDMEELTTAFLLMAREDETALPSEPVAINEVVAAELERAQLLAGDKPVKVESTADDLLMVDGPEKVLSVLIGNLLRNAFSYTDSGRVRVHVGGGQVVIEDSGIGIPEKEVDKVFRPYFRAAPRRRGGHGVGLTIVKRLSDRFGWPVEIDSTPDVGTRVVVSFPASTNLP